MTYSEAPDAIEIARSPFMAFAVAVMIGNPGFPCPAGRSPRTAASEFGAEPPSDDMAVLVLRATGG